MLFEESPLVSVIIPAYNAASFLSYSIRSALDQDYPRIEIIVVDDGSLDRTFEIAKTFESEFPEKIKAIKQTNGKQGKARNTGIFYSKGSLIAFLDADDEWTKEKISNQVNCLNRENLDLVYSDGYLIATNSNKSLIDLVAEGHQKMLLGSYQGILEGKDGIKILHRKNRIPASSVLCRRTKLLSVGGFNEKLELQNCEDYLLWVTLIQSGARMKGYPDLYLLYRMHANSSTNGVLISLLPLVRSLFEMKHPLSEQLRIQLAGHIRKLTEELVSQNKMNQEKNIFIKYNNNCPELKWQIALKLSFKISFNYFYLKVLWRHTNKWIKLDF